jgi:MYXO-CTERM domain-containing protein
MKNRPLVAALSVLFLAACGQPSLHSDGPLHLTPGSSPIIGGTTDTAHPAVALLYNQTQGYLCTGTMITDKVFLTAGHCTQPDSNAAHYQIAGGSDPFNGADWVITGAAVHTNPGYSASQIGVADTGIVVLGQSAPVTPMAWQYDRDDSVYAVGTQFTAVGYGLANAPSGADTSGTKRKVTLSITDLGSDAFAYGSSTKNTCEGDSGGPAIETINGVPTVIGTVSYGDQNCGQYGVDMRTDDEAAFISQYAGVPGTPTPTPTGTGTVTPTPTPTGTGTGTPTPTPNPTGTPGSGNGGDPNGGTNVGCSVGDLAGSIPSLLPTALALGAILLRRRRRE